MVRLVRIATFTSLTWGALAFGAVYPWAYQPLAVLCVVTGILALVTTRAAGLPSRPLLAGLLLVVFAIGVQLIPLSPEELTAVSPVTPDLLRVLDVGYAVGVDSRHALSIHPASTVQGLALLLAFVIFSVGLTSLLSIEGARWLAGGITVLGAVMALVGIIQKPLFAGEIYGFWAPIASNPNPFGPFVNKNHFAGWMLMALPVALALLFSNMAKGVRVPPTWRDRVLWLGSRDGSMQLLLGATAVIMGLALVMTMSRSGMAAGALALAISVAFVVRGHGTRARRAGALGYLAVFAIVIVAWAGSDLIAGRFQAADWATFNARRGAWSDAWRIATLFPWTGTGFNTYGIANTIYQSHDLHVHYAQAHNDYLQLAAEGGVLLTVPVLLLGALFLREAWLRFRDGSAGVTAWWLRAGAVVGLVAIAVQEVVEFSLQMPGNAALCAALCALALHRAPVRSSR